MSIKKLLPLLHIHLIYLVVVIILSTLNISAAINSKMFVRSPSILLNHQDFTKRQLFIGFSHESPILPEELLFEEKYDDDDDKLYDNNFESSFTDVNLFTQTKQSITLSSKENAYFVFNSENKVPIALYTLFCSWKSFLG